MNALRHPLGAQTLHTLHFGGISVPLRSFPRSRDAIIKAHMIWQDLCRVQVLSHLSLITSVVDYRTSRVSYARIPILPCLLRKRVASNRDPGHPGSEDPELAPLETAR
jgi:hypothetical protein